MILAAAILAALSAPAFEQQSIFPANPQHNHGSSIVETAEGDLLACWFHGGGERRSDDVMVQGARKRKGESEWSAPFVMADTPDLPDCNPVLFIGPDKTLWLFWVAIQNNEWGGALLKYRKTKDYQKDGPPAWDWQDVIHTRPELDGTYLEAIEDIKTQYAERLKEDAALAGEIEEMKRLTGDKLHARLGWMTRVHPIITGEGRLMLGLYSDVFNCSIAAFTQDNGATWTYSEPIANADLGNIQPSFVKKKDGSIVCYMRDNGYPKKIRAAHSTDDGRTWPKVWNMSIPNPGSSVECIALNNGNWVMVCNDRPAGRHRLSALLSEDEGETWPWSRGLVNFEPEKGSGSYPSLIQAKDGTLHCTFSLTEATTPGSTISHVVFNEDWIREGD